jgi:hypothetical protein
MQPSSIYYVLVATILVGIILSVAALIIAIFNGRTSHRAQVKASSHLRELYERTYRKTPFISRRLISITRPGKIERRVSNVAPPTVAVLKEPD